MKKTLSLILCICMMLSFGQGVFANELELPDGSDYTNELELPDGSDYTSELELPDGSDYVKGFGLADEITLLEKNGFLKSDDSIENRAVENEVSPEEQVNNYAKALEETSANADDSKEKNEDPETLLNEYKDRNNVDEFESKSEQIALMATGNETRASISYYPGTTVPTYTSVTGWSLRDSYTADNGTVMYSYYYYVDDHFAYIDYLMDYCGWLYYDDSESSDGTYATIYLVKGSDMIGIVADFYYNETVIMVTPTANVDVTSISLDISSRTMIVGNQYTLEATIYPSNATNQSITWSSSNSSVASVSSSGVVTAKAAGNATITAKTSNGKKATCSITVKNLVLAYYPNTKIPTFTSITGKSVYNSTQVEGSMVYSYDLDIESHTDYEAYLVNKDGWEILAEETASDYSSFSALYGKGDVTVFVIADFEQGLTGIVFDAPATSVAVTGVTLNKNFTTMTVGDTMTLSATISPSNATNKNVTWSSSNTSIASVSSSGVVTAKAAGNATITVKTADGNKTASCAVTVNDAATSVTGVSLNKTSTTLSIGESETLVATISPSNATNKNVTWSSSNTSIASVSSSGVVTANAAGTATITVKTADGNKTASCTIEVVKSTTKIIIENASGRPGDTVKVKLKLKAGEKINSIAISNFEYDTSLLTFEGFSDYEHIEDLTVLPPTFDEDKEAIVIGLKTATVFDGDICTLNFKIKDNITEGVSQITAKSVIKNSSTLIDSFVTSGTVTVRLQLLGDMTGNDSVDIDDAIALFQYSMLPDLYPINYVGNVDFDKNGTVDIDDAILLFQYSMLPDLYPIE